MVCFFNGVWLKCELKGETKHYRPDSSSPSITTLNIFLNQIMMTLLSRSEWTGIRELHVASEVWKDWRRKTSCWEEINVGNLFSLLLTEMVERKQGWVSFNRHSLSSVLFPISQSIFFSYNTKLSRARYDLIYDSNVKVVWSLPRLNEVEDIHVFQYYESL